MISVGNVILYWQKKFSLKTLSCTGKKALSLKRHHVLAKNLSVVNVILYWQIGSQLQISSGAGKKKALSCKSQHLLENKISIGNIILYWQKGSRLAIISSSGKKALMQTSSYTDKKAFSWKRHPVLAKRKALCGNLILYWQITSH